MGKETFEKNIEKPKPRTSERDIWREFYECVNHGEVDKILELAVFLSEHGRKEDAKKVLNKAYSIEDQNFREKAKELLEGFEKKSENS